MSSSGRAFVAKGSLESAECNPIIHPKTLQDKIRRFIFLIEMNTGFYVLDPWERKVAKNIAMVFQSLKKLNYQYEVTTGLYMLESWEKYIVNSVVCAGFALVAYTTMNHLPTQSVGLLQQLSSYGA
ncbi:hypothetical protein J3B02_003028 [Coemansia erecta]|nr:hypothetical protein J3B02_003028 [Coemansia erecta]